MQIYFGFFLFDETQYNFMVSELLSELYRVVTGPFVLDSNCAVFSNSPHDCSVDIV